MAKVEGLQELQRNMRAAAAAPSGGTLDQICIETMAPLRNRTNSSAPRPSLKGTAVIVKRSGRGRMQRVFWVTFKGMGLLVAHLIEFGTAPHSLAKGASRRHNILQDMPPFHPGTAAEPFFRPSFEATKGEMIQTFGRLAFAMMVAAAVGKQSNVRS